MGKIIEIKDLSFAYPAEEGKVARNALDHVSLSVDEGSFVAVLGHNGSGKSTLAKMMSMVLAPDSGSVIIGGIYYFDNCCCICFCWHYQCYC